MKSAILLTVLALLLYPKAAMAQQEEGMSGRFVLVNRYGDVMRVATPNPARMHFHGLMDFVSADYFRGEFDGVQEDWDDMATQTSLATTVELGREGQIWRGLSVTAGTVFGFSDDDPFENLEEPKYWYESDNYVGVAGEVYNDYLVGLTLTDYNSPNNAVAYNQELALALSYNRENAVGMLGPSVKAAWPIDGDRDGMYVEVGFDSLLKVLGTPSFYPFQLSLPLVFGMGLSDYYADDEEFAGYIETGLVGSVPLRALTAEYGRWLLDAGLLFTFRDNGLQDANPVHDDAGDVLFTGFVGARFIY